MSDQSSNSDYEDNFDLSPVTVDAVRSSEAREIFAPVMFSPKNKNGTTVSIKAKVGTGAIVSCMPASMLSQLELSVIYSPALLLSEVCLVQTSRTVEL